MITLYNVVLGDT